ncbi:MAG: beta-N-acetylhexosaminidase [Acidobacteriota bacterium]
MTPASRRELGQLLIGSFEGTSVPVEYRALAREFDLGGTILFGRNIEAPEQVAELAHDLEALGGDVPGWVSVDQEGGRVARLQEPFTRWPPMITLGRAASDELAVRFARALAAELTAVGVTLNYAPVLDIHTNPKNPVIGDRALAERAEDVARLGRAIVTALQGAGVAACGKHFPGHGDTSVDSHHDLPVVEHAPDRLRAVEFAPFRAAIDAGVAFIMTAHVLVPSIDAERPATLSPAVVRDLLREELGFTGVILSDDLEMKAISARTAVPAAAVSAVTAGCDGVLICSGNVDLQAAALEALVRAVESGEIPRARADDALARLRRAKERFLAAERPRPSERLRTLKTILGREEHQIVAAEMAALL